MTRLLNDAVIDQVKGILDKELKQPVEVLFFGEKLDCDYCSDTRQLLEEIVRISPKLSLSSYDLNENAQIATQYHVDKTPGIVIAAKEGDQLVDYGVRFAGIPSGHEFTTLIHDLILVSSRDSGLSPKARAELHALTKPVHLQVFVTPT